MLIPEIRDPQIERLVESLGEHYRSNVANRFLRPALLQLPVDNGSWDLIEALTKKSGGFRSQGFMLDELYKQIAAAANLVEAARREFIGNLRNNLSINGAGPDRILRDMAVNNFSANVQVFADQLNRLLLALVEIDKTASRGRRPLYTQIPELRDIKQKLAKP
jgi:hypothetical protein